MVKHSAYRREAGGFDFVGLAGSRRLGGTLVLAGWVFWKKVAVLPGIRYRREAIFPPEQKRITP